MSPGNASTVKRIPIIEQVSIDQVIGIVLLDNGSKDRPIHSRHQQHEEANIYKNLI